MFDVFRIEYFKYHGYFYMDVERHYLSPRAVDRGIYRRGIPSEESDSKSTNSYSQNGTPYISDRL